MSTKAILEVCSDKIISYKPGTQANLDVQLLQTPSVCHVQSPKERRKGRKLSADKALQETPGREPKSARKPRSELWEPTRLPATAGPKPSPP